MPGSPVKIAQRALQMIIGPSAWKPNDAPILVYDASGPLLFEDYVFTDASRSAWVRLFPHYGYKLVSVEEGEHPAHRAGSSLFEQMLPFNLQYSDLVRLQALRPANALDNIESYYSGRLYCYHYPNLGVLREIGEGRAAFVDILDDAVFPVSEAGEELSETRSIYSFLQRATEAGAPGPIDVPTSSFTLGGKAIAQKKNNWCAAASFQMIADFYGIDLGQDVIAREMRIPENPHHGGAVLNNQVVAYETFLGASYSCTVDTNALAQACINELTHRRPVKIGIFQHAQTCFGWSTVDGEVLYEIHDPMPVGIGSLKWQNPSVIWTQNHIFVEPQGESHG